VSTYYTTCAKCGDEIGSAHEILWLAARPFHPECATERDRLGDRDAAVVGLLEAARAALPFLYGHWPKEYDRVKQAIANYVRLRDE